MVMSFWSRFLAHRVYGMTLRRCVPMYTDTRLMVFAEYCVHPIHQPLWCSDILIRIVFLYISTTVVHINHQSHYFV